MEYNIKTKYYNFTYKNITYEINIINPKIEFFRKIEMLNIVYKFKKILKKYNINYKSDIDIYNVINRYIFYYFSRIKYSFIDPLFPFIENPEEYNKLLEENINYIFMTNKGHEITKELKLHILFIKSIENIKKIKIKKDIKSFDVEIGKNWVFFKKIIKKDIFSYRIPINIYLKLKNDYNQYKKHNKHSYELNDLIYCLLIRYETLFSRGNQWGVPLHVKQKFKEHFNVNFEVFASSFNHYYDYYCSIFYDIEKYFRSVGYFQNVIYRKGFFMANPPYEENLLYQIYNIIEKSLTNSKENITFMLGTPTWDKYKFTLHDDIKKSKYYISSYKFEDGEVEWYDFLQNKYMKIPSSTRYILSNNNKENKNKIKYIIDKYWIQKIK